MLRYANNAIQIVNNNQSINIEKLYFDYYEPSNTFSKYSEVVDSDTQKYCIENNSQQGLTQDLSNECAIYQNKIQTYIDNENARLQRANEIPFLQSCIQVYLKQNNTQYTQNTIIDNGFALINDATLWGQSYPNVPYLTKDEVYNNYAGSVIYQDKVKAFNANYDRAKKSIKIWIENGIFTGAQGGLVDFQGSNNANLSNIDNLTQLFKQFADEALASNGYGKVLNQNYGYWQTAFNIAYQNSKSVVSIEMNPFEVIHINRAIANQKRAYWDLVARYNVKMNDLQLAYNNWLNAIDATIKNQYLQDLIDFNVSVEDYNIISRWIVNLPVLEATLTAYEQEDSLVKCFSGVSGLSAQQTYDKWKADFIESRRADVELLKTAIEVGTGFSFGNTGTKLKGFANYANDITALLIKPTEDNLGMGYVENDLIFVLNANDLLNENIFVEPSIQTIELANNQVQVVATQNFKSCVVKLQIVDGVLKPVLQTKNNKSTFTIQSKIVYKKEDNVLVSREFIVS